MLHKMLFTYTEFKSMYVFKLKTNKDNKQNEQKTCNANKHLASANIIFRAQFSRMFSRTLSNVVVYSYTVCTTT